MDLNDLRQIIDSADYEIIHALRNRMETSARIAEYKNERGLPVYDAARERQKLSDICDKAGDDLSVYAAALYSLIFEISRSYQSKIINEPSKLMENILSAIDMTEKEFPRRAVVACQGVEGAYAQIACDRLFDIPNIMYMNNFEGVFSAIDAGLCRYGVLPIENSTAGSVNKIYDLMMRYNFNIVRSVRLKIDCNILTKKGTGLSDIKEIYSHEHAISQCTDFLKTLKNVIITVCENTAVAAKIVADSDRCDIAAISSRSCMSLYDLSCIAEAIQDTGNNYTRFICISKNPEIYPGANKTSIMMVVSNKPGSLYKVLSKFFALGINLVKLESRPLPDRDFEVMFYFDLETSVYSSQFAQLICDLDGLCEKFKYLGSYTEII
ncbi:MAG: prephenate dehydratase domain-containing protein [Eubacteriales bacterium]|jgi:chorismate mutase/prephenate dehydratase|nr:prephenate dehydratase domain-containing protein [Eubacteriales bacterium]